MTALFRLLAAALAALSLGLIAAPAAAQIEIDVNQGVSRPIPIAIPTFTGSDAQRNIAAVVASDLERTGLFQALPEGGFRQRNLDVSVQPNFPDWQVIGAQALVNGQAVIDPDGRLRVDFRLWDVGGGQQLLGLQFVATPDNWRRIAHQIADRVYERLTGQTGHFDTRIVFVAESGPRTARIKRLAIMDQDGFGTQYLTDGSSLVMTPRFSSNEQEITYMAIRDGRSRVYLFNIETGRQETLGEFPGMVYAPRFSPDGARVAFSAERAGNSDIYIMNLRGRGVSRVTSDPAIDTSPSFSPDGTRVAFNSDRGGSPQIYVMNADGSGARRISQGGGRYSTPVWSPRGDLIAFTRQNGGTFHIGVMRPDGSGERLLTSSYLDEGPSWSPNGQVIMFTREARGGGPRLYQIDVNGRNERATPYPGQATDPAWSPRLQ